MIFTNINTLSVLFFLVFIILSIFFTFFYIKKSKKNTLLSEQIKKNKKVGLYLLVTSFFLIIVNIFGIKGQIIEGENLPETNILFLLDVSKSMLVEDTSNINNKLSRLEISKGFILDYISNNPNNNYGLSIFAGESLRILPFTNDTDLFKTFLIGVNENNLTKLGSEYKTAIEDSYSVFSQSDEKGLVILLTDITDEIEMSVIENQNSTPFFVIGIGTEKGGYIPIGKDFFGNIKYKVYNGNRVLSQLNIVSLNKLSNILKTDNFILNDTNNYAKLASIINKKTNNIFDKKNLDYRFDYIRVILFISLLLFLFSIFYLGRKK